ncbi:RNI-like protein [Hortaea werneckii]|nr:RNI-like protein [Hortaea werneckii]
MSRARRMQRASSASSSSSSSTSPERGADDDNDSFMLRSQDSQSSLGLELSSEMSHDAAARLEWEERCRVSPVARLPAELLISIFARLSAPGDLRSCMLVSKEWARNSVGLLWHRPGMNRWDSIHSVVQSIRKADKFFAYQDLVKRLNMSTLAGQVSDGSVVGMAACKRVERLTLTNCTKLTDYSLQPLVDGNKSLLALDITGLDQVTDRTMITVADNCLRLQGLNITGCKKISDASIVAIAKNCRHLKRLKFNGCAQLTDTSIMTVAAHSTHLLEIDLHGLSNVESPSITALLTSCPHLREVRLAHCSKLTDEAFTALPAAPDSGPFSLDALRILDLTDCNDLGDKAVERIIDTCPRLRNLILAKCRSITDRAVLAITRLGKNLHYIHLGHCARITDYSVEALAKSCNRIRYIDLACCSNLTDASVVKLAGLPKLKRIGLVKCAGITDRSIYALAMGEAGRNSGNARKESRHRSHHHHHHGDGQGSVLERVHLSYCTQLTLDSIHILLNNCPKLTHLSLTGVQAFLRDELLVFCREAPPEFNDHQRDVFCVFSGNGVGRLRDFLNNEKALQLASAASAASSEGLSSVIGDDDGHGHPGHGQAGGWVGGNADDDFDGEAESDGSNTPVINVDVNGEHYGRAGGSGTPVVGVPMPGPSSGEMFMGGPSTQWQQYQQPTWGPARQQQYHFHNYAGTRSAGLGDGLSNLSSSAPATTSSLLNNWPIQQQQQQQQTGSSSQPPQPPPHGQGGAQHVTGMMSAAALDDVDEGDEAFGEGSDGMGG